MHSAFFIQISNVQELGLGSSFALAFFQDGGLLLFFATVFKLGDHFLFHLVDVGLLLFQTLAGHLDVLLQEHELIQIQVAVLGLLLQHLLLFNGSRLSTFDLFGKFFFGSLLLLVVATVFGAVTFLLEHLVDHVLDVARRCVVFNLGPLLHDSVLELNTELVLA